MTLDYFGPQLNAFIVTIHCYGLQNSVATITGNKKHITYFGIRKQEDFQKLVILIVEPSQTSENVRGSQWVRLHSRAINSTEVCSRGGRLVNMY